MIYSTPRFIGESPLRTENFETEGSGTVSLVSRACRQVLSAAGGLCRVSTT